MIVIAIIGILAAIAVPQYAQYTRRAAFSEIKLAATPIKTAVELCVQRNGAADNCRAAGTDGSMSRITTDMQTRAASSAAVTSVTLSGTTNPIVTVVPVAQGGIVVGDEYILTGTLNTAGDAIESWAESGGGCTSGYC